MLILLLLPLPPLGRLTLLLLPLPPLGRLTLLLLPLPPLGRLTLLLLPLPPFGRFCPPPLVGGLFATVPPPGGRLGAGRCDALMSRLILKPPPCGAPPEGRDPPLGAGRDAPPPPVGRSSDASGIVARASAATAQTSILIFAPYRSCRSY